MTESLRDSRQGFLHTSPIPAPGLKILVSAVQSRPCPPAQNLLPRVLNVTPQVLRHAAPASTRTVLVLMRLAKATVPPPRPRRPRPPLGGRGRRRAWRPLPGGLAHPGC